MRYTKYKKKRILLELNLTTNGRLPLLNRTELAGQLLLSIPPPIEHLVGLGALLFTAHTGNKITVIIEQYPKMSAVGRNTNLNDGYALDVFARVG